jgi:hypothetical protein
MAVLNLSCNTESITQDCGDGGYTTHIYNDKEELVRDHALFEDNSDKDIHEILDMIDEDSYENGYLCGSDTIDFQIKFDPSISEEQAQAIRKAITEIKIKPFSVHGGQ